MKKQMLVSKIKNPVQFCVMCKGTTLPSKIKKRCSICNKIYLIYGDKK